MELRTRCARTDSGCRAQNTERKGDSAVFCRQKCAAFFREYSSLTGSIEPEGVEKLCRDLRVETDDISMLVLAWMMDAKRMGYLSIDEWLRGLSQLQCDSLGKLRNKLDDLHRCLTDTGHFSSIFLYAFDLCRHEDESTLDIDTAKMILVLLLDEQWPLLVPFLRFWNESPYRVVDKTQWMNVLQFSTVVSHVADLQTCSSATSWPAMVNEFVEWLNQHATL